MKPVCVGQVMQGVKVRRDGVTSAQMDEQMDEKAKKKKNLVRSS